jgi:hypothetical protein
MQPASLEQTSRAHMAEQNKTSFFAKPIFIRAQRITALALMTFGLFASTLAPVTSGATAAIVTPLLCAGSALFGISLIQQVVGNAPGCEHGKIKRVVAGSLMLLFGPIGMIPGGILWYLSHLDNKYAAQATRAA